MERLAAMSRLQYSSTGTYYRRSMAEMLYDFHAAKCSDDRDRIYALIGLGGNIMEISYRTSVERTYLDFAIAEICKHPGPILSCAGAFPAIPFNTTSAEPEILLPSWVPDWRSVAQYKPLYLQSDFGEAAAVGATSEHVTIQIQPSKAIIASIMPGADLMPAAMTIMSMENVRTEVHKIASFYLSESKASSPAVDRNFMDTISAGALQLPPKDLHNEMAPENPLSSKFINTVRQVMSGRRCFFTDEGHFGIGPNGVRTGDVAIVLASSRQTFVVRPRNVLVAKDTARTLIGDCYIPSFVAAVMQDLVQEAKQSQTTIKLR